VPKDGMDPSASKTLTSVNPSLAKMEPLATIWRLATPATAYLDIQELIVRPTLMSAHLILA